MEYLICKLIPLIAQAMPALRTVDEDYGQLEALTDGEPDTYPLTFPAVLIDTPRTEWTNVSALGQKGECSLRVRLIIDCYDDTHARSGTTERAALREAMRHELHALLQGLRPVGEGALVRTASRFFTAAHGIKVYEATYTVATSEYVTRADAPHLRLTPEIGVGVVK